MALEKTTQLANRCGIDLVFHNVADGTTTTNDIKVNYVNEVSFEITGDAVYATGGKNHKRIITFNNPIEGTMTISTQIMTPELMTIIAASAEDSAAVGTVTFKSREKVPVYKITGSTLWKDADGKVYTEELTVYKASVRNNYSASYTGDGDPHSVEITIDMLEDETDGMIKIVQAEQTTSGSGG